MPEALFVRSKTIARARRSWLKEAIDGFVAKLTARRHPKSTLRTYTYRLLRFGEFTERQGIHQISQLPEWVEPFVKQLHLPELRARASRSVLAGLICHLMQEGRIPTPEPVQQVRPHAKLVEQYAAFLIEHCGFASETMRYTRRHCAALMAFLDKEGVSALNTLRPEAILRFLTLQGKHYSRNTMKLTCSVLRGYLSYLHRSGAVRSDLSGVVVSPRVYKQEQCPRFLTRSEVEKVLGVIDRQTVVGKRDYAIVLLLSVYGLRGIEVVRLRLEDIDWRNQKLYIRGRKAGNSSTYPLAVHVGDAIVAYLEKGRPTSVHRQVFLSVLAPYPPLGGSWALVTLARKYLARAAVQVVRPGTHTFRYSCAQRLFEDGASLKSIGDYLGHGHPDSTQWYTKMAIDQLREVALGDGEDIL